MNETIKFLDETTKEFAVKPLSYRATQEIMTKCAETKMSGMQDGKIDIFGLQVMAIERAIPGLNTDLISKQEGDRLFSTHCAKAFNIEADEKNSKTTSDEQ